ncbi:MAG TPA: hypothetical protein DEQ47_12340, partial [Solibacterales bacterium]|nr:hypothetical protein [Bryobacterales bacterium]
EFNNPLLVRAVAEHAGRLPKRWGLFEISETDVVTSAVKMGETGGIVLRVYEANGRPAANVKIRLPGGVASAAEVNLIEESIRKLNLRNNTLSFDLHPYEIKTFKLEPGKTN